MIKLSKDYGAVVVSDYREEPVEIRDLIVTNNLIVIGDLEVYGEMSLIDSHIIHEYEDLKLLLEEILEVIRNDAT